MALNPGAKLGPTIVSLTRLVCELASSLDLTLSLWESPASKQGVPLSTWSDAG